MEPVSAAFLALVCVPAAACLVAAVVLWPRFAGRGVRPAAARTGLLLASQALLTASVVLLVNRYFVFYATWDDLLGGSTTNAKVRQVQPSRGAESAPSGPVHRVTTALGPKRRGHHRDPAQDGRVDRLDVGGARSGLDGQAYVYLPPQYFQPQYAGRRLPVVVLVPGGPSDAGTAWLRQARLPEEAGAAGATGHVQPMVYAMVRPVRGLVPGGRCLDLPGVAGGQAETFYAQDLPLALAATYRLPQARAGWGVAGFGEGGQCAARLAMLHSDRFSAAASLNGRFGLPADGPGTGARTVVKIGPRAGRPEKPAGDGDGAKPAPGDPYGGSEAYRLDDDLTWRLQHFPPPPVSVLAAAAAAGPDAQAATGFAALAKPPMRVDKLLVPGAPATLGRWRHDLPAVLQWLSAHLRGE
ncbi:alpha/beta hydrolase [Actinomadura sp. NTSP31]|uniref:alpha/beta hydrolase n=1 Tax=Actinomadura sp. NTSP31 TaxID=1735447 RepID=UPI0035BFC0EC